MKLFSPDPLVFIGTQINVIQTFSVSLSLFATVKLRVTAKETVSIKRPVCCNKVGHIVGCVN